MVKTVEELETDNVETIASVALEESADVVELVVIGRDTLEITA